MEAIEKPEVKVSMEEEEEDDDEVRRVLGGGDDGEGEGGGFLPAPRTPQRQRRKSPVTVQVRNTVYENFSKSTNCVLIACCIPRYSGMGGLPPASARPPASRSPGGALGQRGGGGRGGGGGGRRRPERRRWLLSAVAEVRQEAEEKVSICARSFMPQQWLLFASACLPSVEGAEWDVHVL